MKQTKLLIILDGWGHSETAKNNAIALANTPNLDNIKQQHPHTLIGASGANVGLPKEQMGNSEVGHLSIGSGRIIEQDLSRIDNEIENQQFCLNPVFNKAIDIAKENNKTIHLFGLLSDGGVHSHQRHIHTMLKVLSENNCKKVCLHLFTDGRDVAPRSAKQYIEQLEIRIKRFGVGRIASIVGRYYAMDRDNHWSRIKKAYDLIANSQAAFSYSSASQAIDGAYQRGESDEFIEPSLIGQKTPISEDDVIIFMNYRADRARQITQAFTDTTFKHFDRENFANTHFVCLTEYKKEFNLDVAYQTTIPKNTLGEYLSNLGLSQLRMAESEKYAHVTFFLNGGIEAPFKGEKRILIPSPKVATYDLKPEMSAFELSAKLIEAVDAQEYDVIICNFANTDMVSHVGDLDATIKAVEAVDKCMGEIYKSVRRTQSEMLITADHGNAEQMLDKTTQQNHTAHTSNPVPLIYVGEQNLEFIRYPQGRLCDITPTLLFMMGIDKPKEMTGVSLLQNT